MFIVQAVCTDTSSRAVNANVTLDQATAPPDIPQPRIGAGTSTCQLQLQSAISDLRHDMDEIKREIGALTESIGRLEEAVKIKKETNSLLNHLMLFREAVMESEVQ